MTVKEYAELRGLTTQAVTKAIREGRSLPGIKAVKKVSKIYFLVPFKK